MDFDGFMSQVPSSHKDFAAAVHKELTTAGSKVKFEDKAQGGFASYSNPKTKKSLFNFYFRKNGFHVRLYPVYDSGRVTLTDFMVSEIDKASDCKQCSPKCSKGYDFDLRGKHYFKCRYSAFQFLVTDESKPVILRWVKEELV